MEISMWTNEQKEAINKSGSNIIVSAGAGSGKTSVLTERVITKLKQGIHINELLILTFTNNAAYEMKTRIKKAILCTPEIIEEASLIDSTEITTFDAYALSLVKKYHYYLNIDENISIIDSSIIKSKKKEFINIIFNNLYKKNNSKFQNFVLSFGTKNDKQIRKTILELDNKFDLITEKEKYLNTYIEYYYNNKNIDNLWKEYEHILLQRIETIKNLLLNLSYEASKEYYEKIYSILSPLLNSTSYIEIKNNIDIKLPPIRNTTEEGKFYKKQISETVKSLSKDIIYSEEMLKNTLLSTKDNATVIINILKELTIMTNNYKFNYNVFEFGDISKLAIKLIKEHEDVKESLRNYYKEIMIDEYQDTSDIQEEFTNLIENNNVYMVGDIKQSIYRFRNANPNIFKIKYDQYKENINGYKIDLNKNFRSRFEVLDSINNIFNHIMDDKIGNANYLEEHQMVFGNKTFNEIGANNYNNNLEIYNYDYQTGNINSKEEIEAFIIANDIKSKIKNKYLVFDDKLRPCKYQDFCILMDRTISFDLYKKIFDFLAIPLNIYKDNDIIMSDEVLIINNIISLIINIKNNIFNEETNTFFVSIARSYLFNLTDQEIYDTITNHQIKKHIIYKLCLEIANRIDYLSNKDILELILQKFDFYQKMITVGNIEERLIVINNLFSKFIELNKININIYGIRDYLNSLINDGESIKIPAIINNTDSVTITNIHKSKGLEYKICYFSGFHKEFNTGDIKNRIVFNEKYGLILPSYNKGYISTFVSYINKEDYMKEEISEKLRLLYVALTRAKEKMIIVTSLKNNDIKIDNENGIIDYNIRLSYKSFNDVLSSISGYLNNYIKNIDLPIINSNYKLTKNINIDKLLNHGTNILVNEKEEEKIVVNNVHYSKDNILNIDNIKLGEHMHYILENLNFINPNYSIYSQLEREIIEGLLSHNIMQNIKNATIYKEFEFIYDDEDKTRHGIIDLMLEYNDHIDIIDYKLKNTIDKAYLYQLNGYKQYIENKTKKKVNTYLYSLLNKELKKIS